MSDIPIKGSAVIDYEAGNQVQEGKSSLTGAIFNLSNCAIGAALLVMPMCFSNMGIILGTIVTFFGAFTTGVALHFIGRLGTFTRKQKYSDLAAFAYGKTGEIICVVLFLILLLVPLCAYQIIVGEYIQALFDDIQAPHADARLWSLIVSVAIIFPFSLIRNLGAFSKASMLCLVFIAYTVFLIIGDFIAKARAGKIMDMKDVKLFDFNKLFLPDFSTIVMAYCTHTTVLDIFNDLKNPTDKRKTIVSGVTSLIVAICYVILAIAGYLTYGNSVDANVLNSNKDGGAVFDTARLTFSIMLAITYPMLLFPTRTYATWIVDQMIAGKTDLEKKWAKMETARFYILNITFIALPYLISVGVRDLDVVFAYGGSVSGAGIVFLFPSYIFLKLRKGLNASKSEIVIAYFNILLGWVLLLGGPIFKTIDLVNG
jgi:amino acid permease